MAQKGVRILTEEDFRKDQKLKCGYPDVKEKFEYLFFDSLEIPELKKVRLDNYFILQNKEVTERKKREKRNSSREFNGRVSAIVAYPKSGRQYEARVKSDGYLAVIEPVKPNTAFWVLERSDFNSSDVIDLRYIPHIRQIHNREGREFLSTFR